MRKDLLALIVTCICAFGVASAQTAPIAEFDIPSQPLEAALRKLAETQNLEVIFTPDDVKGIVTPGVKGRYTAREAIQELLKGTGLVVTANGNNAFAIKPASAKSSSPSLPAGPLGYEKIEVTGSHLKRGDVEGPQAVTTYRREDIDRSGVPTLREFTNTIPQMSVSAAEDPLTFLGASRIQLRGLSTGSTLLLLNGRRLPISTFDINSIPLAAIERIEVLPDTASAVYGGDALAGAINFVLKKSLAAAAAAVRLGTSSRGDANETEIAVVQGKALGRWSGFVVLNYFKRDGLLGADRDLTSSTDFRRFGGTDFRSATSFPGNIFALPGAGNLPGLTATSAGVPAGSTGVGLTPADFRATAGILNRYDAGPVRTTLAPTERLGTLLAVTGDLSGVVLDADFLVSRNRQETHNAPVGVTGQTGTLRVPANNPFNPFGVAVGVNYRFAELGPSIFDGTVDFVRGSLGAKGAFRDAEWEVSLVADRAKTKVDRLNEVGIAAVQAALNDTDPRTALNVFSATTNNTAAALARVRADSADRYDRHAVDLLALGRSPLVRLPAGDLQAVAGAQFRSEVNDFYSLIPATGSITNFDQSRRVSSAFAEALVPLISRSMAVPMMHSLEATVAGRYDKYSDAGRATSPQYGIVWRVSPDLLVRTSYGEAFKPPTLQDYSFQRAETATTVTDPLRGNQVVTAVVATGGNPNLKPERARSITAGIILEPRFLPSTTISATWFSLKLTDPIQRALTTAVFLNNPDIFGDRIVRAAPTAADIAQGRPGTLISVDTTFTNFGQVRTRGADFAVSKTFKGLAAGDLDLAVNGTYVEYFYIKLVPGAAERSVLNTSDTTTGAPLRVRINGGLTWTARMGLQLGASARYYCGRLDHDTVGRIPAYTLFDLHAAYQAGAGAGLLMANTKWAIGVLNAGDKVVFANSGFGYDYLREDPRGRYFYVSVEKRF